MAVAKMKLLTIAGPVSEFDKVSSMLFENEFHPENVLSSMKNYKGFYPFTGENPYSEKLKKITELSKIAGIELDYKDFKDLGMKSSEIDEYIEKLILSFDEIKSRKEEIENQIKEDEIAIRQIEPLINVDINVNELYDFKFCKFRFGRMPKDSYEKLKYFSFDKLNVIYIPTFTDEFTYGMYFVPRQNCEKVDSIFATLHFERIRFSSKIKGTPKDATEFLNKEIETLKEKLVQAEKDFNDIKNTQEDKFLASYSKILYKKEVFDVRKYAAKSGDNFVLTGWVSKKDSKKFINNLKEFDDVSIVLDNPEETDTYQVPTKLDNPKIFRPFEQFIDMYGTPAYNEFDPTPLVAITYSLIFGIMFGDLGQGFLILLAGLFMWKKLSMPLGKILCVISVPSMLFGCFYNSIFGIEGLLPWEAFAPLEHTENIMVLLISAVAIGVVIIFISMITNVINGIRQKDIERAVFSTSGIVGFVFYFSIIIAVLLLLGVKKNIFTWWYISLFVVVPLIIFFLKEPILNMIKKKKEIIPGSKAEFFTSSFFELFESMLSYITNTVSFVRIGAFAINHAGMMLVVKVIADMAGSAGSIPVMIIGNIFVTCLEGLIVGIQVLRLEFYEIFSKFYKGDGRQFCPIKIKYKQNKED